jgi:aldoxime dehydratase
VQFQGERPAAAQGALDGLDSAFGAADGPGHHDRATHTDGAGYTEVVSIAYWDDPAVFERWFDANREGWIGDGCRAGGVGLWIEAIRPKVEEFETLFSVPERTEGIAVLSEAWSDEVQEHAYWGVACAIESRCRRPTPCSVGARR